MGGAATRLTKRIVDQAQPGPKPSFIWDSELRGFGLRIEPTGTKSFLLRYRTRDAGPGGPKRFFTIGRFGPLTVDQAREQAKAVLGAVSLGQDPAAELNRDRAEQTFGAVAELFLAEHVRLKRKAGTHADYESLLRLYALPTLGKRKLTDITRGDLGRLHASLNDRPYRANRLLAVIGSLYSFAETRDLVPEHYNPARRIEKFREDRRERYLSQGELERLGLALQLGETQGLPWRLDPSKPMSKHLPKSENRVTLLSPPTAAAIRLLMFTGARLREVLELRWEYVDLERGLLLLPDSKTGRKTIVLNSTARAILAGLPQQGPFVVPGRSPDQPRADLKKPWRRCVRMRGCRAYAFTTCGTPLPPLVQVPAWGCPSLASCSGTISRRLPRAMPTSTQTRCGAPPNSSGIESRARCEEARHRCRHKSRSSAR